MKKLLTISACLMGLAVPALAINNLQLDIAGGTYYGKTPPAGIDPETTVAGSNPFTLQAYLKDGEDLTRTYYLSVAVIPKDSSWGTTRPADLSLGTFDISSTVTLSPAAGSVTVTSGMSYGLPPVSSVVTKELAKHDIYETFFSEFAFKFDGTKVAAYNTQTDVSEPGQMYYVPFTLDVSGLAEGYGLHFDLYSYTGDKVDVFAPFSHDAQSGTSRKPGSVPDGGTTIALLGLGLVGLGFMVRRKA